MKTKYVTAKHALTGPEKQELGMDVAEALAEVEGLKEQLDSLKKDYQSRIKIAELRAASGAAKIRSGYEMREVECEVGVDPKTRMVYFVALSTGELVKSRPANQDDLQQTLDIENEGQSWPAPDTP